MANILVSTDGSIRQITEPKLFAMSDVMIRFFSTLYFRYEIYLDEVKPNDLSVNFLYEFMDLPVFYLTPGAAVKFRKFSFSRENKENPLFSQSNLFRDNERVIL